VPHPYPALRTRVTPASTSPGGQETSDATQVSTNLGPQETSVRARAWIPGSISPGGQETSDAIRHQPTRGRRNVGAGPLDPDQPARRAGNVGRLPHHQPGRREAVSAAEIKTWYSEDRDGRSRRWFDRCDGTVIVDLDHVQQAVVAARSGMCATGPTRRAYPGAVNVAIRT
jgi:hypothetical protein